MVSRESSSRAENVLKTNGGGTWPAAASTMFSSGVEDESTAENTRSHVLSFSSILVHGDHGWGLQRTIEYGRQRYFLFKKKTVDFSFPTRLSRYRSGRGEMDFVQGEVHAKCTGGLVRCSPRHKMVIPRHVVFLAG